MGEAEKADLNSSLKMARSQLDESRCLDEKVDALQLIIDQRDHILKEKDSELKIKSAELDAFTDKQKKLKTIIQDLESELKEKLKECEKLQNDLEVARNDTQVETDSQLTVQLNSRTKSRRFWWRMLNSRAKSNPRGRKSRHWRKNAPMLTRIRYHYYQNLKLQRLI